MASDASCQAGRANDRQGMHRRVGCVVNLKALTGTDHNAKHGKRVRNRCITRCALRVAEGA